MADVEGTDKAVQKIQSVTPKTLKLIRAVFTAEAASMAGHTKTRYMTGGTTPTRLRTRSGRLKNSVRPLRNKIVGTTLSGGIGFGTVYGRVQVGPYGQETVITPKTKKFLTIPLGAAMTKAGVTKGSARSGVWGETFIQKTQHGHLMIFGKRVAQKGKKAGQAVGAITPLFLLVKSVKVRARVHPEKILNWEYPRMVKAIHDVGIKLGHEVKKG